MQKSSIEVAIEQHDTETTIPYLHVFLDNMWDLKNCAFDYGYRLDERWKGTESELIRVSAILKEENPNKQYSLEEMRVYAVILMLIRGICNQMNEQDLYFDQMLGIDPDIEDDHIFKAEMLRNINTTEKKSIPV